MIVVMQNCHFQTSVGYIMTGNHTEDDLVVRQALKITKG